MKPHKCSACDCEQVNLFKHYMGTKFLGYQVVCPQCGLSTKDLPLRTDALRTWNNSLLLKENKK